MQPRDALLIAATAKTIRSLRKDQSLSQEQMATKGGLDASTPYLIEAGKRGISLLTLVQLAKGLGISPISLLDQILMERTKMVLERRIK